MNFWTPGELIVRREINWARPVIAWPVFVVDDSPELLALYTPTGAPFSYGAEPYPNETGHHPWWPKSEWTGHGVLMLQRPGDHYAVWHFWEGRERAFARWYINLQDPFRRTSVGIDTDDHELDLVIDVGGQWEFKDVELLQERIVAGRYSVEQGRQIVRQGDLLAKMIEGDSTWWGSEWTTWNPPSSWTSPNAVSDNWEQVPWTVGVGSNSDSERFSS